MESVHFDDLLVDQSKWHSVAFQASEGDVTGQALLFQLTDVGGRRTIPFNDITTMCANCRVNSISEKSLRDFMCVCVCVLAQTWKIILKK